MTVYAVNILQKLCPPSLPQTSFISPRAAFQFSLLLKSAPVAHPRHILHDIFALTMPNFIGNLCQFLLFLCQMSQLSLKQFQKFILCLLFQIVGLFLNLELCVYMCVRVRANMCVGVLIHFKIEVHAFYIQKQ